MRGCNVAGIARCNIDFNSRVVSGTMKGYPNSYKKNGSDAGFNDSRFSAHECAEIRLDLWSFDLFVFCLASTVVSRTFAVIGFFYFVTWLCHDFHLNYIN